MATIRNIRLITNQLQQQLHAAAACPGESWGYKSLNLGQPCRSSSVAGPWKRWNIWRWCMLPASRPTQAWRVAGCSLSPEERNGTAKAPPSHGGLWRRDLPGNNKVPQGVRFLAQTHLRMGRNAVGPGTASWQPLQAPY